MKLEEILCYQREEIPNCPVCLDPCRDKLCSLKCGHVFHTFCVETWMEKEKKCPFCRKIIRGNELVPICFTIN